MRNSRCFAALSMTDTLLQQPASLVLSDKNSRNYGLYQGTPSGVPQRSAPMIAKAFRP